MWIVRHLYPGRKPPVGVVQFRGLLTKWQAVRLEGAPGATMAAHVPDDHADVASIRAMMRGFPSTTVVEDTQISPLDGPRSMSRSVAAPTPDDLPSAPGARQSVMETGFSPGDVQSIAESVGLEPTAEALRNVLHLCNIVRANGWSIYDFRGAGRLGDPSEQGGRGKAGLTLAELSLTRPPLDWDDLRAAGRPPWESADWSPPSPGWLPPSWPDKEIVTDPASVVGLTDLQPGEIVDPVAYEQAKADGRIAEIDPTDPAATSTTTVLLDPATLAPVPPDDVEDPLAGYPADDLAAVAAIVQDLAKRQGKTPHFNAVNFLLDRVPLPHVTKAQIDALMVYKLTT